MHPLAVFISNVRRRIAAVLIMVVRDRETNCFQVSLVGCLLRDIPSLLYGTAQHDGRADRDRQTSQGKPFLLFRHLKCLAKCVRG